MIEPWRRLGLWLLLVGIAGVGLELVLLEHYEDPWQWAPLALLGLGLVVGGALLVRPAPATVHALRAAMAAYVVAGGVGVYFHLKANLEFERELRPSMAGIELVFETLRGAMPALAPGAMAQLGLLGLLVAFRHPILGNHREP
jgi:hypothetical protein